MNESVKKGCKWNSFCTKYLCNGAVVRNRKKTNRKKRMKNEIVHFRESIDCWCPVCNAANMETKPKNVLHLQRNLSVNLLVYCSIWCEKWCFVRWLKPKFGFGFVECRKSPMGQTMIEKRWCEWVFGKEDFSNKKTIFVVQIHTFCRKAFVAQLEEKNPFQSIQTIIIVV